MLQASQSISGSSNLPLQVFDADFLPSLLVVVEPFSLLQINPRKLGGRLQTFGLPFPLKQSQQSSTGYKKV